MKYKDRHIPSKETMQNELEIETMCTIQHDGWTCGSCFFTISKELDNSDWQNILLLRGDYKEDELDNLPKDREESLIKIYNILTNNKERR
tara:strand:- start:289 stop:558 length:270 start_codon:yes stop_codon:yes gene_type:complete